MIDEVLVLVELQGNRSPDTRGSKLNTDPPQHCLGLLLGPDMMFWTWTFLRVLGPFLWSNQLQGSLDLPEVLDSDQTT